MAQHFEDPGLSDDEHTQRDTQAPAGSTQRPSPTQEEREARKRAKGKRTRVPRTVDEEGFIPIARHSEEYRQVMQMLSYYACLSGAEKYAMEMAGEVSEATLQILAQALNDEDMAHVLVRDAETQTQPEHTVVPHNLQSLLDATLRLHNQRVAHEKLWYRSGQYQSTVEKITICEVAKDGKWLENDERQDVTVPEAALHEPAGNEMDRTRIAYYPLILLGKHNRYLIRDSGAEDLTFQSMTELHQLGYQQSAIKINEGIARIDS